MSVNRTLFGDRVMRTLHKLSAGLTLAALTAFGLTTFALFWFNPLDPPVWGFTDKYCQNDDYKAFKNFAALKAANGKKDPKAKGEDKDKIWIFKAYIEWGDGEFTCRLLEDDVKAIGEQPKKPATGGGEEGGGEEAPPQETIPQKTKADKQADTLTKDEADDLRECWESKATGISVEIKGWNSVAIGATEAVWGMTKGVFDRGLGETTPYLNADSTLYMDVQIYPHGISNKIPDTAHQDTFKHTVVYTQMHETFHVGQIKAIFDATGALPKPYEWWELEVQAHNGTSLMYRTLYGKKAGVPSLLLDDNEGMTLDYKDKMEDYKDLETELADPTTTEARKKEIENEMESLSTWLKDPDNLPPATANNYYKPDQLKNFECD